MTATVCPIDLTDLVRQWNNTLDGVATDLTAHRPPDLTAVACQLCSLPLSRGRFGAMWTRLAWVGRYAAAREWGAAKFEARLLSLQTLPL